jgi:glycosyltransferase involved in cell wall biosynthesis
VSSLRVLHAAQSSEYGLGRYLADLLAAQVGFGWEVVLAGDPASWLRPHAIEAGAAWLDWQATRDPGPSVVGETRALATLIDGLNPDVVHLHSSKAGLAGRAAVRGRRPTIFQPHAWSFFAVDGPKRQAALLWERAGARWADTIVCGSEGEQAEGAAAGIKARRWRVVPNAVDTDRFSPDDRAAARSALGLGEGPLVVCAARLAVGQKGQDLLLKAWPTVVAVLPAARLVLVGEGPDRAWLQAGAPDSVVFVGNQEDVAPWYRAADVVVQPSRYETLSLSVLEALACERPVVATDAVGMREAVGEGGVVVPREDAAGLAAAIVARLQDPLRAQAEGRAGRARVVAAYGLERWRQAMREVTLEAASR